MKKTLGEKRYTELQKTQDGDYQSLTQLADRFELPQDKIDRVYDMKTEAEKKKQQVEANPLLTEEQRAAALLAISRETERSVADTLGQNVFKAYKRTGASWIQGLAGPPPASAPEMEFLK